MVGLPGAAWAAGTKERDLEKVALQHIKDETKAAERAAKAEVHLLPDPHPSKPVVCTGGFRPYLQHLVSTMSDQIRHAASFTNLGIYPYFLRALLGRRF